MKEKQRDLRETLNQLLDPFLKGASSEQIRIYLAENSHLPGPRGNLELADVFAQVVEVRSSDEAVRMWKLCLGMTQRSAEQASISSVVAWQQALPTCDGW